MPVKPDGGRREHYLFDEVHQRVLNRWPIEGWSEAQIQKLEREILSQLGENVVLRDSKFDEPNATC